MKVEIELNETDLQATAEKYAILKSATYTEAELELVAIIRHVMKKQVFNMLVEMQERFADELEKMERENKYRGERLEGFLESIQGAEDGN